MVGPVIESWQLSRSLNRPNAPASESEIAEAESALGRALPETLRTVYRAANGGSFLRRNLSIEPLLGGEPFTGLDRLTCDVAEQRRSVPPELLIFGGNGSDRYMALWLPNSSAVADAPVVTRPLGDDPLALAGTSLSAFLTGWTAYYLMFTDAPSAALDALGVPADLRRDPDDDLFVKITSWADPKLDDPHPDPHERPMTVAELRARFGGK